MYNSVYFVICHINRRQNLSSHRFILPADLGSVFLPYSSLPGSRPVWTVTKWQKHNMHTMYIVSRENDWYKNQRGGGVSFFEPIPFSSPCFEPSYQRRPEPASSCHCDCHFPGPELQTGQQCCQPSLKASAKRTFLQRSCWFCHFLKHTDIWEMNECVSSKDGPRFHLAE